MQKVQFLIVGSNRNRLRESTTDEKGRRSKTAEDNVKVSKVLLYLTF